MNSCVGCKYAIKPQGYFNACNSPAQLQKYRRIYYVDRYPGDKCHVVKKQHKDPQVDRVIQTCYN